MPTTKSDVYTAPDFTNIANWSREDYRNLTAQDIATMTIIQLNSMGHADWIPPAAVAGLTPEQIAGFTFDYKWYNASWLNSLTVDAFKAIPLARAAQITAAALSGLDAAHVQALSPTQINNLTADFSSISSTWLNNLTPASVPAMSLLAVQQLSTSALAGIDSLHLGMLTPSQIAVCTADFSSFTADWFNHLSLATFQNISAGHFNSISQQTVSGLDSLHLASYQERAPYNALTAEMIGSLSTADILAMAHPEWLPVATVSGLTAEQIPFLKVSFSVLSAEWLNSLSIPAFQALTGTQLNQISPTTLATLDTSHLVSLTASQVGAIAGLSKLSSLQFGLLDISGLSPAAIEGWTSVQYNGLTANQLSSLSPEQIKKIADPTRIPLSAVSGLTPEQAPFLKSGIHYTGEWINQLTIPALQALTPGQFYYVKRANVVYIDDAHLAALTAEQVAGTNKLDGLNSHQFGLLNISALSTSRLSGMNAIHLAGLTAVQIASLSAVQFKALTQPEQLPLAAVSGISPDQIRGLTVNFSRFPASWLNNLSIPAFQSMSGTQVAQLATETIGALDMVHHDALIQLQEALAASQNPSHPEDTSDLSGVSLATISNWSGDDYAKLTAHQMSTLSPVQVLAMRHPDWIPPAAAAGMTIAQMANVNINFSYFSVQWLNSLPPYVFGSISVSQLNQLSADTMAGLNNTHLAALSADHVAAANNLNKLGSIQFGALNLSAVNIADIKSWSQANYSGLTAVQMASLSPDRIKEMTHVGWLPAATATYLNTEQVLALKAHIISLTPDFLNRLTLDNFDSLTGINISALPVAVLMALDDNHFSILREGLNTLSDDKLLELESRLTSVQKLQLSEQQRTLLSTSEGTADFLLGSVADSGLKAIMQSVVDAHKSLFSFSSVSQVLKNFASSLTGPLTAQQYADLEEYVLNIKLVTGENSALYSLASGMILGAGGASVYWTGEGTAGRIGHLTAGSTPQLFNQLITNWFDGGNQPASSTNLNTRGKSLFVNDTPSVYDVHQGTFGDCALLAALQAVSYSHPDYIKSMIQDNANGTYSVRLFTGNEAKWVTTDDTGFSRGAYGGNNQGYWPVIVEHAFAKFSATYWNTNNVYTSVASLSTWVLDTVTGNTRTDLYASKYSENSWNTVVFEQLKTAVQSKQPVMMGSYSSEGGFVGGHAFAIVDFNATNDKFLVTNPWGADYGGNMFEATMSELRQGGVSHITISNSAGATGVAGQLVTAMATASPSSAALTSSLSPALLNDRNALLSVSHI